MKRLSIRNAITVGGEHLQPRAELLNSVFSWKIRKLLLKKTDVFTARELLGTTIIPRMLINEKN